MKQWIIQKLPAESGAQLEKQRQQQAGRSKVHCDLHRGKMERKGTVPSEKNILGGTITVLKAGTKQVKRALIAWFLITPNQEGIICNTHQRVRGKRKCAFSIELLIN